MTRVTEEQAREIFPGAIEALGEDGVLSGMTLLIHDNDLYVEDGIQAGRARWDETNKRWEEE